MRTLIFSLLMSLSFPAFADYLFECSLNSDTSGQFSGTDSVVGRVHDDGSEGVFVFDHGSDRTFLYLFPGKQNPASNYLRYADGFSSANYNFRTAIRKDFAANSKAFVDVYGEEGGQAGTAERGCTTRSVEGEVKLSGPVVAQVQFQVMKRNGTTQAKIKKVLRAMSDKIWEQLAPGLQSEMFRTIAGQVTVDDQYFFSINVLDENYTDGTDIVNGMKERQTWEANVTSYTSGNPFSLQFATEGLKKIR